MAFPMWSPLTLKEMLALKSKAPEVCWATVSSPHRFVPSLGPASEIASRPFVIFSKPGELDAAADHAKFVVTGTASAYLRRYEIQHSSGRVRYPRTTGQSFKNCPPALIGFTRSSMTVTG